MAVGAAEFASALGDEMAVNVGLIDMTGLLEGGERLTDDDQAQCLLALGAAMRGPDVLESAA